MYWKHTNATSPQIEAVLSQEDVTLEDLMDEEDILQECKSQNKKLIEFLVRPEIMQELVTLTTVEPPATFDIKEHYKYPNIACELLTSDVATIHERLANDENLLGKLYNFLECEPPLNPLLASFFSKILSKLVSQRQDQDWYSYQVTCLQVLEFLKSKGTFVKFLVQHVGTSAIMDLMLKFITNVEGDEIKQNILNWLDSEHLVQSLIDLLRPTVDSDRQSNAAQLLGDIIARSRDATTNVNEKANPDPIIATLESTEAITILLDNILGGERTESCIVSGIQVLLALLNFNKNGGNSDSNFHLSELTQEKNHRDKVVTNFNTAVVSRLKDFHDILLDPPKKPNLPAVLRDAFGNTRLQVTRLLAALFASSSEEIRAEIAKLGTINVLLDLFFKYSFNNFLHTQVQNCLENALVPNSDNVMYANIFVDCRLLGRVMEAWADNQQVQAQVKGTRRGYMGHLTKIANNVADKWCSTPMGEFVEANLSPEAVEAWKEFVSGPLAEVNKKHARVLGGVHPSNSVASDNQDEYSAMGFPTPLQLDFTHLNQGETIDQLIESLDYNNVNEIQALSAFEKQCEGRSGSRFFGDEDDDLWDKSDKDPKWMHLKIDEDDASDSWQNDVISKSSIAPIVDPDPWGAEANESAAAGEGWANFDSFTNFEAGFNGMTSGSSPPFQDFDKQVSALAEEVLEPQQKPDSDDNANISDVTEVVDNSRVSNANEQCENIPAELSKKMSEMDIDEVEDEATSLKDKAVTTNSIDPTSL